MKKLYTLLCLAVLFLISLTTYAQVPYPQPDYVLIPENFEGSSFPAGWTQASSPAIQLNTTTPCQGTQSARMLISSSNQQARLRSPIQTTTGSDIKVSFSYKIINQTGGSATPTTFGSLFLEYSTNANAITPTWTTYSTIDGTNHTPSASCTTHTGTIAAANLPAGSDFAWRIRTNWLVGSYYVYIDEFLAVEQISCIEPIYVKVSNVTFDQAQISWTDLTGATQWEIQYGGVGFPPNFTPPFGTIIPTTTRPTTITGLADGTEYDVYVRAICGPGNESNWSGPIKFQTIAVGTDCNTPMQITGLPYNHAGDTQTFGNSYTGSPGTGCIGNNYLQGYDVVYKYTPTTDDYLNVKVSDLVGEDNVGIFMYQSCAGIGTSCYAGGTTSTGSDIVFDVFVVANQPYYFVLSTAGVNTNTAFTLDIKGFDCPSFGIPNGLPTYEYFGQDLSAFDNTRIGVKPTNDFADLVWYQDNAGVPGAVIPNTNAVPLTNNAVYHVNQVLGTCQSAYLKVTFTEFDCLGQLGILTTDTGDEICDEGTTILGATAATTNLFWYENQFGGPVLGTGNSFETDVINLTKSYWVGEAFVGEGNLKGQANPGPSTVSTATTNNYGVVINNISSDFVLVDVQVFSTAAGGATTVTLVDINGGTPDQTAPVVSIPAGSKASPKPYTIPLGFELKSGSSYRLLKTSGPELIYTLAANNTFPYNVGTVAEVTSGSTSSSTTTSYYYFYNWTITEEQPLCESPRIEVIATVNKVFDILPTATSSTVCVNQTANLTVSSTDTNYVYTWTWTDPAGMPQTLPGPSIQPVILENTTFHVTGYNPVTDCISPEESISIEAIGAGEIEVVPEVVDTCVGEIIELFAGGSFNHFNDPTNDWTTVNNSAGPGDPAAAGWKLVNSPYSPIQGMTSNDNSQFYISISDKVGPTGTVDTELISPSMNLVGIQNATLTFYHHFDVALNQSSQAKVEVSEAHGAWVTLKTYTTKQGTPAQFAKETISLSAYTGAADVRIRYKYTGNWAWWWAVDNVDIVKDYTNGKITWSTQNKLFLDPAATVPYTGTPTNRIYFKSDVPGAFTYNVELDIIGCSTPVSSPIVITVNETLPPTGDALQDYVAGQTLTSLDVTGQNLRYYIFENGIYKEISPNFRIIHGTTYYITQTTNGCESDYLEVTVNLNCPAPTDLAATADVGATGTSAAVIITWTPPANTRSIQDYYIEITDSSASVVFQGTADATVNYRVIQGLAFDEEFDLVIYSVCDPLIPVYSTSETVTFNTNGLGAESLDFDGFTYYPNPTSNVVTFTNVLPIKNIEVFTVTGQKVLDLKNINKSNVIVDFGDLTSGVYFSLVTVGDSVQVVRIIRK